MLCLIIYVLLSVVAMPFFTKKKDFSVQSFILKLVNNNCPELTAMLEGPRIESRVNMVVVVMIVPMEKGRPQVGRTFMAVTKEFSTSGVAVVLNGPQPLDQVILGFRYEGAMTFMRAEAKHLNPMGGGFYQLGFQMLETVNVGDWPELKSLGF